MIDVPSLDPRAILPILMVSIGSMVVLMGEVFLPRLRSASGEAPSDQRIGAILALISVAFLLLAFGLAAQSVSFDGIHFNPDNAMIVLDRFSGFGMSLVSLSALLTCILSVTYLAAMRINHGEYYALLLIATAGMMFMIASIDLMAVFLGLEIMSIPIYVLAGFDRTKLRSNESALKYFLIGSFASGILLYGMALVYGATGALDFKGIGTALAAPGMADNTLALAGLGLIIVGFGFKVSTVPFHQWTPDVYEGAPTTVTAYMSVSVKAAAFLTLMRLLQEAFGPMLGDIHLILWVLAALTIVVGNVMAIIQDNVKRLLAYSSVAHAGYILIGYVAATGTAEPELAQNAYQAVLFYLLSYLFINLGAFSVLVALARRGQDCDRIEDLAGLAKSRPGLAALMSLFMIALAGIPGTAGFFAKFFIFKAAVDANLIWLTIVAVFGSLISVFYYLRIPVAMYMREPVGEAPRPTTDFGELVVLAVCAIGVLVLGFFPNYGLDKLQMPGALDWAQEAIRVFYR